MSEIPDPVDSLRKPRILIVEDEPMLAFTMEEFLIESGFDIVGVAGRLDAALALIESHVCDAAILDANLFGLSSGPAALALKAKGVPFMVVSGYLPSQQNEDFAGVLHLQKPCKAERLVEALHDILASSSVSTSAPTGPKAHT